MMSHREDQLESQEHPPRWLERRTLFFEGLHHSVDMELKCHSSKARFQSQNANLKFPILR